MAKKGNKVSSKGSGIPAGVRIISVFNYVISLILVLSGLAFLLGAGIFSSEDAQATVVRLFEDLSASTTIATSVAGMFSQILVAAGILSIMFAVLFFFIARGLWRRQNWARILAIIFFAIGFIGALADILRGDIARNVIELVIDGFIAGYLLFNSRVKTAFSK